MKLLSIKYPISVILASLFFICLTVHGQNKLQFEQVKIGDQVWMSKNLAVKHFRNGDAIPQAKSREEWMEAGANCTPAWSHYQNIEQIEGDIGILYNWFAVTDPRGLAPAGWRIPTVNDFELLANALGGNEVAGKELKSDQTWYKGGNGTNASGFNGIPSGSRDFEGYFYHVLQTKFMWTLDAYDDLNAWYFYLEYIDDTLKKYGASKNMGMSVRCIKL